MNAAEMQTLLVCPTCHGSLAWHTAACSCSDCGRSYSIVDGIPVLLPDQGAAHHDELVHDHDQHKGAQAAYYDQHEAEEFEIERPNRGPAFYAWLMREKFRRSLAGIEAGIGGRIALTVCGGSGMEAQFLAEAGFQVIASDLSLGAAQRCRERARRFNLPIESIVADVERLPFRDRSVALVYVHDGLHHLANPMTGLTEMVRVAASAISITEPADAAVTALAVRLGLALAYEEPGNRVARIRAPEVEAALLASGFDLVRVQRYAMYYRHQPGQVLRFFSNRRTIPIALAATHAVNLAAGRWGNKVAVKALRTPTLIQEEED